MNKYKEFVFDFTLYNGHCLFYIVYYEAILEILASFVRLRNLELGMKLSFL